MKPVSELRKRGLRATVAGLLAVLVHRRMLKPADSEDMRQEWNLPGSIEVAGENL